MPTDLVRAAEYVASSSRISRSFPDTAIILILLKDSYVVKREDLLAQQFSCLDQTTNTATDDDARLVVFC